MGARSASSGSPTRGHSDTTLPMFIIPQFLTKKGPFLPVHDFGSKFGFFFSSLFSFWLQLDMPKERLMLGWPKGSVAAEKKTTDSLDFAFGLQGLAASKNS